MPDSIEDIIAALPDSNQEAMTTAVTALREGLEGDIATLKGTHGDAIKTLGEQIKGFEVQVATLQNDGTGSDGGGSKTFDTVSQVRARHQKEAADAVTAQELADKDATIAALKGGNFKSDLSAAKAEGLTEEQLALATTPELLAMMRKSGCGR